MIRDRHVQPDFDEIQVFYFHISIELSKFLSLNP